MQLLVKHSDVTAMLTEPIAPGEVSIAWLGQAGFAMRCGAVRWLIDPYLSDSLAVKYAGKKFPHVRMMAPPVEPEQLHNLDYVLCTHAHTDHMDPGTLGPIARNNPRCRFIVPAAALALAHKKCGLPLDRLIAIDAGEQLSLHDTVELNAVASAHEQRDTDEAGHHRYLGYVMRTASLTLYHSGDTVVYPGLEQTLASWTIDVAMLPCNGRDAFRRDNGVPGNMSLDEAIALAKARSIPVLVPHHFGMFDFNTCDPDALQRAKRSSESPRVILPNIHETFSATATNTHSPTNPAITL